MVPCWALSRALNFKQQATKTEAVLLPVPFLYMSPWWFCWLVGWDFFAMLADEAG